MRYTCILLIACGLRLHPTNRLFCLVSHPLLNKPVSFGTLKAGRERRLCISVTTKPSIFSFLPRYCCRTCVRFVPKHTQYKCGVQHDRPRARMHPCIITYHELLSTLSMRCLLRCRSSWTCRSRRSRGATRRACTSRCRRARSRASPACPTTRPTSPRSTPVSVPEFHGPLFGVGYCLRFAIVCWSDVEGVLAHVGFFF